MEVSDQCALCLNDIIGGEVPDNDDVTEQQSKVCLRQICHYFKENLNHELLIHHRPVQDEDGGTYTKENSSTEAQGFSVLLCRMCTSIVRRLTNLCEELELIQMHVDHSIKELVDLLCVPCFGNRPIELVRLAKSFSQTHCDWRRKPLLPELQKSRQLTVKLRRCDVKLEKAEEDFQAVTPCLSPSPSLSGISVQLNDHQEEEPKIENSGVINRNKMLRPQHYCAFCSRSFVSRSKARLHTVVVHPETFFSTFKIDGISDDQFLFCCQQLFSQGARNSTRNSDGHIKCPDCDALYKGTGYLKLHMVDTHYEYLCAKLTRLQMEQPTAPNSSKIVEPSKNILRALLSSTDEEEGVTQTVHPTVQELLKRLQEQTANENGEYVYNCSLCPDSDVDFGDKFSQEKHVFQTHPEYFFLSVKMHETSKEKFTGVCSRVLQSFQNTRQILDGGGQCFQSCSLCSCTFLEKGFLISHQIQSHFNLLSQKVIELQELDKTSSRRIPDGRQRLYEKVPCHHCSVIFDSQFALAGHLSHVYKKGKPKPIATVKDKFKCSHCGVSFTLRTSLRRHVRKYCRLNPVDKQTSLDTYSVPTGATEASTLSSNAQVLGSIKCKYCTTRFASIFSLSRHVKLKHPSLHGVEYRHTSSTWKSKSRVKCAYCTLDFATRSNLKRHVRRDHPDKLHEIYPDARTFICQICGKSSGDMHEWQRHQNVHFKTGNENNAIVQPSELIDGSIHCQQQSRFGTTTESELWENGIESEAVVETETRMAESNYVKSRVKLEYTSSVGALGATRNSAIFAMTTGMLPENNMYVECEDDDSMNFFDENNLDRFGDETVSEQRATVEEGDPLV